MPLITRMISAIPSSIVAVMTSRGSYEAQGMIKEFPTAGVASIITHVRMPESGPIVLLTTTAGMISAISTRVVAVMTSPESCKAPVR